MASTDDTRQIATSLGARIVDVPVADYVDKVRNQAMAACKGDWILVVDADETVPATLATRLRELAATPTADAYALPRKNYLHDVWLEGQMWPDHQTRFFRNGVATWAGMVHEPPEIRGKLVCLPADPLWALEHPGACPEVRRYLARSLTYGRLEAIRFEARGVTMDWLYLVRRPLGEFFGRYFGGGWRQGVPGLVMSLMQANYQLVACIECWELQRAKLPPVTPQALRRGVCWEIWRAAIRTIKWTLFFRR
jgi:glycosyltransferase involved in cell wall biosynthesis